MNQNHNKPLGPREQKQPYARPNLLKHGTIESLTQQPAPPNGVSQPPITVDP